MVKRMPARILDGAALAKKIKAELYKKTYGIKTRHPCLVTVLVGDDPASKVYIANKEKDCKECGFDSIAVNLSPSITEIELINILKEYSEDDNVDGIILQQPLPWHLFTYNVIEAIIPHKDVDGFHPTNIGYNTYGTEHFLPCTPAGIMELLDNYSISVEGKHAVVIGRSNIVGKPMSTLLLNKSATVTTCHSKTKDLKKFCKDADILISAVGKPGIITADMVKEGAVVIDVGITRVDKKLYGDVDFEAVSEIASWITPVPGGVGPMTRAMLMKNTYRAFMLGQNKKNK